MGIKDTLSALECLFCRPTYPIIGLNDNPTEIDYDGSS